MKLLFRPSCFLDVEECADDLVSEAGEVVARAWYQSLKAALDHIQRVPEIGRLRLDLPVEGIRTLNLHKYPNHLVFYRVEKNTVEILRVRHGMMNLVELFSE
jgi:plasmid stabilization system protein ParE